MMKKDNTIRAGLCSITFRQYTARQVVDTAAGAGLAGIEWGGDVHVPPGDEAAARAARTLTLDAGLAVSSYGSYHRVLDEAGAPAPFGPTLDSACVLGAPVVRIWAGTKGSDAADAAHRARLADAARQIADQAAAAGIRIAFEFHRNTLTDTNESARRLLADVAHPNAYVYWQPMYWGPDLAERRRGLDLLGDRVRHVHVFFWRYVAHPDGQRMVSDRRPLEEGAADWAEYFAALAPADNRFALLEHVRGEDPEQFRRDAATLRRWLGRLASDDV